MDIYTHSKYIVFIILFSICSILPSQSSAETVTVKNINQINVCFSPNGGCTAAIIKELDSAKSEILVQSYSFTSAPIAKALLHAKKRGVNVQVILDKSQKTQKYSSYTFFQNHGIPVYIDNKHAIAHNKIIIIDRGAVITGSFNFTKAAEEKNAENLLLIQSEDLADIYRQNWIKHRAYFGK